MTRFAKSGSGPTGSETSPKRETERGEAPNVAARMGRWSAQHRKLAIWGWLGFVFVSALAGGAVGTKTLDNAQLGVGDSGTRGSHDRGGIPEERRRDGAGAELRGER